MNIFTPKEAAAIMFNSVELIFNPFKSGTAEHRECADEILRLTEESFNDK